MSQDLIAFLSRHTSHCEELITWGEIEMQVNSYLCDELPPVPLITSVRGVLFRQGEVLIVRDPVSQHIFPGGRIEAGESLLETLRRELLEETGWTIQESHYLGVKHSHHLTPRPANYAYPYPDFLQVIYAVRGGEYRAEAKETDGYELETSFQPLERVQSLPLTLSEKIYLEAGLKWIAERS